MGAIESANRALRALLRSPVVFAAAGALGVLKVPVEAAGFLRLSYVYGLFALLAFPFTPVLLAALYGVADAALGRERRTAGGADGPDGTPDPGDAWRGVRRGYLQLLIANVLYAVVQHAILFAFTALAVLAAFALFGGLVTAEGLVDGPGSTAVLGSVGLVGALAVGGIALCYVVVRFALFFLFQLYKPATVVGGRGPIEAFRESYGLVRANLRTVAAFVLVRAFVFVVFLVPGLVALIAFVGLEVTVFDAFVEGESTHVLLALAVLVFAIGVVQLAFLGTYRVAFYRELAADAVGTGETQVPPSGEGAAPGRASDARAPASAGSVSSTSTSAASTCSETTSDDSVGGEESTAAEPHAERAEGCEESALPTGGGFDTDSVVESDFVRGSGPDEGGTHTEGAPDARCDGEDEAEREAEDGSRRETGDGAGSDG